jgi:hypothetical protein
MVGQNAENGLQRAIRVADQSCTAYAILRDKYNRRACVLDLSILLLSAWLTAMVFVEPTIGVALSPSKYISKELWIGLLSIGAFALSLVQLQVNWKGRAQTYHQAAGALSAFVKEYRRTAATLGANEIAQALARYDLISSSIAPIPDSQFLVLKQKHKLKVKISQHLDTHPAASLTLIRLKLWLTDSCLTIKKGFPAKEDSKE